MIALVAALLLSGETRLSAAAGTPYSSLRVEHGVGPIAVQAAFDLTGQFVRPGIGAQARLFDMGPLALSMRTLIGRVLPTGRVPTVRTWDGELALAVDADLGRALAVAEAGLVVQTDFRAEHSLMLGRMLVGVDLATAGPFWLVLRGGAEKRALEMRAIGWAGAAVRW